MNVSRFALIGALACSALIGCSDTSQNSGNGDGNGGAAGGTGGAGGGSSDADGGSANDEDDPLAPSNVSIISVSRDGQVVVFQTSNPLVPEHVVDEEGRGDRGTYIQNLATDTLILVEALHPEAGQGISRISISDNGAYAVYVATSGSFSYPEEEIIRLNLDTMEIEHPAVGLVGEEIEVDMNWMARPSLSADGNLVGFGADSGRYDHYGYVRDMKNQTTKRVQVGDYGEVVNISPDGRFLAVQTTAALSSEDTNGYDNVYVIDVDADEATLVSAAQDGTVLSGWGTSLNTCRFTDDSQYVTFQTSNGGVFPGDEDGGIEDSYLRDLATGEIIWLTEGEDFDVHIGYGIHEVSADGRWVLLGGQYLLDRDSDELHRLRQRFSGPMPVLTRGGEILVYGTPVGAETRKIADVLAEL